MSNSTKVTYLTIAIITTLFLSTLINKKDYNCKDFSSQKEAQKMFDKYETDIYGLDRDGDGIACESLTK
jgi:hypothetical protein